MKFRVSVGRLTRFGISRISPCGQQGRHCGRGAAVDYLARG